MLVDVIGEVGAGPLSTCEEGRLEEKRGEARHEAKRKSFCCNLVLPTSTSMRYHTCAYSAHSECPHDDDDYLFYT